MWYINHFTWSTFYSRRSLIKKMQWFHIWRCAFTYAAVLLHMVRSFYKWCGTSTYGAVVSHMVQYLHIWCSASFAYGEVLSVVYYAAPSYYKISHFAFRVVLRIWFELHDDVAVFTWCSAFIILCSVFHHSWW